LRARLELLSSGYVSLPAPNWKVAAIPVFGELGGWLRLKELIRAILRGCIGVSRGRGTGGEGRGQGRGKRIKCFLLAPHSWILD